MFGWIANLFYTSPWKIIELYRQRGGEGSVTYGLILMYELHNKSVIMTVTDVS